MNVSAWLSKIIRKLWLLLASTIVLCAVLLSTLRLTLPYLNDFRDQIAVAVSQELNAPVKLGYISAGWQGSGPSLTLVDVKFAQQEQQGPLDLSIDAIHVEVDFWRSIVKREFVASNFVLEGIYAELNLAKLPKQDAQDTEQTNLLDTLQPIFLNHLKRFDVQNSQLAIVKQNQSIRYVNIEQLTWNNRDTRHQGVGELSIAAFESGGIKFVIDLYDDKDQGLSGQFYVNSQGLNLAQFFKEQLRDDISQLNSQMPFEAWLNIDSGIATDMVAKLHPSQITWLEGEQEQSITLSQGELTAKFDPVGSTWQLNNLLIGEGDNIQGELNLMARNGPKGLRLQTDDLLVKPLMSIARLFSADNQLRSLSQSLSATSVIESAFFHQPIGANWQAMLSVDNISWQANGALPGLENWHLAVALEANKMRGVLSGQQSQVTLPTLFEAPLQFEQAAINIDANWQQSWQVRLDDIQLTLPQAALQGEILLQPDASGQPEMQMFMELGRVESQDIPTFLPKHAMGDFAYDFVTRGVRDGYTEYGHAIWHGSFQDFPYRQQQGIFHADLAIRQAEFLFQPDWPAASAIDLTLSFLNQDLLFKSQQGRLLDVKLIDLNAAINNVYQKGAKFTLAADVAGDGQAATQVLQQSSLAQSVGKVLDVLYLTGNVNTHFELEVPLDDVNSTHAQGAVTLNNNIVLVTPTGFELSKVNGVLEFDMENLSAQGLKFEMGHAPYIVNLTSADAEEGYSVNLEMAGEWQPRQLFNKLNYPYLASLNQGSFDWQGLLSLNFPKQGFSYQFDATADLTKLALELPEPYYKTAEQARLLAVSAEGDEDSSIIKANIDELLSFEGVLPHETSQFSRAYLVLGEEQLGVPGQGFNIAVHLPSIDLQQYVGFVNGLVADLARQDSQGPGILSKPERIRGDVAQLIVANQTWHDTYFDIESTQQLWLANLNAREFRGDITISEDWDGKGVKIDAEYFNFNIDKQSQQTELELTEDALAWLKQNELEQATDVFNNLPPIVANCRRCEWNGDLLGAVDLRLSRVGQQIKIDELKINRGRDQFNASGYWHVANGVHQTYVIGSLASKNVGLLLRDFDYAAPVRDSSAGIEFSLAWNNAPYLYDTKSLNGKLNWNLGEGYFTEVSDGGARLFSLLSMDSLVRKLRLDFRDVFNKGLFFNKMSGTVSVVNGISSTNDTRMDGVPGNMLIVGTSDLTDNTLDYRITFTPKVTSSLPILVAWMVNPVTGVAALALDQVLESAQVVSNIEFNVTGTFDKPKVEEVSRSSREVRLSKNPKAKPDNKRKAPAPESDIPLDIKPQAPVMESAPQVPLPEDQPNLPTPKQDAQSSQFTPEAA
ncbi:TIGR02099 family protein [Saccharobesus litoralis]|uniref:TIGR02099 family protein n=1 Tax=Saccharobesus litoralis TaxID=2172099 RepID=A0A2S0VX67_9ALTE|nr:YhdP family protein [Saccharobesus litoralis]AWB68801.1 TIGR02099 family protein [Saccharobesus litoralis]